MVPISSYLGIAHQLQRWRSPVKPLLCLAVLLFGSLISGPSGENLSAEKIIAAEHAWAKAAVDHDAAKMASFMADDYIEITLEAATTTTKAEWKTTAKADWVDLVRTGREKYESVDIRNLKLYFHGDVVTVTGEFSQKGTTDGRDNSATGVYVDTWAKRAGHWRLVSSVFP